MKSRIQILIVAAVLMSTPVHADWSMADLSSTWSQVKTKVTTKVNEWIAYWNGPTNQQQVQQQGQQPTQATTAASSAAGPAASVNPNATGAPVPAEAVPRVSSPEAKQLQAQPLYTQKADNSSLKDVQSARDQVKAAQVLKVAQPGRVGTTKLPKTKAGVPLANWSQMKMMKGIKKIPQLDIGTENLISREDFSLSNLHWNVQQPSEFKKLPQPQAMNESELRSFFTPAVKAIGPRGLTANMKPMGKPVTLETVAKITYTMKDLTEFTAKPYKPLSEDELKMVAALILFNQGKHCHMVMGLFHQLTAIEQNKMEATYHVGACAADLKMHQAAFENLSKVIASENADYAASAMTILSKNVELIYEKEFFKLVRGLKNPTAIITSEARDRVNYRAAKGAYRSGEFKSSLSYAEQVSPKSEFHADAAFLIGMDKFATGDKAGALKKLQDLWTSIDSAKNGNLRALTSLNLARIQFSQKNYSKAHELYMQVPKDHPLWVQALIEQGWTQIALEDYAGAIGNMYSLHSPYFKAVYQPESFVVKTIGYLNICQYGDAYKSLTFLEKDYRDWLAKTDRYLSSPKGNPRDVYATVKGYIRGKSTEEVEGVPYQVWREMAHRKDFLNVQTAMNDKIDESRTYEGVNERIKKEKESIRWHAEQAKKRFDQARAQMSRGKVDPQTGKTIEEVRSSQKVERDLTIGYRFQLALLEQGRQGYLDFQGKSQARLDKESSNLQEKAGSILLSHAKSMGKQMSQVIESNEFLRYEVFAGSGENIRYQVAGGEVSGSNRIPAHIKPVKMMNWNFDGEFWEDEIGSYRSSLQNNCPMSRAAAAAKKAAEQARHSDSDEN